MTKSTLFIIAGTVIAIGIAGFAVYYSQHTTTTATNQVAPQSSNQMGMFGNRNIARMEGTVNSVNQNSVTLTNSNGTSQTLNVDGSTIITKENKVNSSDILAVNNRVTIEGDNANNTVNATKITFMDPQATPQNGRNNGASRQGGRMGGFAPGGNSAGAPNNRIIGSITAVGDHTFTLQSNIPGGQASTITVNWKDDTTTFVKTSAAAITDIQSNKKVSIITRDNTLVSVSILLN